jgi:hypothetical protein
LFEATQPNEAVPPDCLEDDSAYTDTTFGAHHPAWPYDHGDHRTELEPAARSAQDAGGAREDRGTRPWVRIADGTWPLSQSPG